MSKRKTKKPHTPLSQHRKIGTSLKSPLSFLNMETVDWPRDLLPEHLWIGSLGHFYGIDECIRPYSDLCDAIDPYLTQDENQPLFLGLLSDFGQIPAAQRQDFMSKNARLIEATFLQPIGRTLSLYPQSPATWLIDPKWIEYGGSVDPQLELLHLRQIVLKLLPGKDEFAGRIRTLPMTRLLKHGKLYFAEGLKVTTLIPKYPHHLNETDRYSVESTARQLINMDFMQSKDPTKTNWARYFWTHNYDIVACSPRPATISAAVLMEEPEARSLLEALATNSLTAERYIDKLRRQLRIDLYDPTRDEILFGLFARTTRLLCLMYRDRYIWARDIAAILLRCLTDTTITFVYLATKGTPREFQNFVKYGEGQQKLLMLHLQDDYPDNRTLEGFTPKQVSEQLGSFLPEIIDIELSNWIKKDARRLAADTGMDRFYHLVFNPASADIHGTWISLSNSNLDYCAEPLHRFHRIPSYTEPPFILDTVYVAQEIYQKALTTALDSLGYPEPDNTLRPLPRPAIDEPNPPSSE